MFRANVMIGGWFAEGYDAPESGTKRVGCPGTDSGAPPCRAGQEFDASVSGWPAAARSREWGSEGERGEEAGRTRLKPSPF